MRSTGFSEDYDLKILKNQREQFLSLLSLYADRSKNKITAVFDGGGSGGVFENSEAYGAVEARYSAGGETADDVIKKIAAGAQNPRELVIVTSDKEISYYVRNCGAAVVSAPEFYSKIRPKTPVVKAAQDSVEYFEKHIKGFDEEAERREEQKKQKGKKRRTKLW